MSDRKVKVSVQSRHDCGRVMQREWLWAEVVDDDDGRQICCLLNTPFWSPFALGDLVTVRRRRAGLAVTGLHRRGGRTANLLVLPERPDLTAVEELALSWAETGTWVEGYDHAFLTVSVEAGSDARPTPTELLLRTATGEIEEVHLLADPDQTPDDEVFDRLVVGR
jgi:hypothetical protein